MKITCHSCQSKYTVSDEKVQGKTVKIKCRKCGTTILVNSSGATNGVGADQPVEQASYTGGEAMSYLVNVTDGDQRTMSVADISDAYRNGVVNAETYVWSDGMDDWQPLGQVTAIATALGAPAAYSQPPPSYPAPAAQVPQSSPAPAAAMPSPFAPAAMQPAPAAMQPAPAAMQPAAARGVGARRDGRRDLFGGGGMDVQPAADDVATSAPFFGGGVPAAVPQAQTGKRDENSVMFSLSALTARAGTTTPLPTKTTATKEDSGLIDLKALADAATTAPAAHATPSFDPGMFPLGMPAVQPVAASSIAIPIDAAPKNRTPIVLAIGGMVALAAIVGAFLFMKGGEEKPPPVVDNAATQAPPAPTPEPVPTPSAEASPAPSATASAAPKVAGGKFVPRGGAGGKAASPTGGGASPPQTAAPPPKSGGCGCAPGDLMCAMKCSTKGK